MAIKSRRLLEYAYPLLNPSGVERLLIVGDSLASMVNSGAEQRHYYGICKSWPMRIVGHHTFNGSWLCQSINSGAGATLNIGPTQHPDDGCIAPHECIRYNYGSATATDTLIHRLPYDAATLARVRSGNLFANVPVTSRVAWWARSNSLQTCRCRTFDSAFGTGTEDVTLDMRTAGTAIGSAGYRYRDFSHGASAAAPLWDCLTGAEDETGRELTFLGSRFELTTPGNGVSIANIGNGGNSAADYLDATTISTDARWVDFMQMWGPFDRILLVLGTNMEPAEEADIVGVWGPNMLGVGERLLAHNASAGGSSDTMVGMITGYDSNITGRLDDMATAIANCSAANGRIMHFDTVSCLPNYAELDANWLHTDGIHQNVAGGLMLAMPLGCAMAAAVDSPFSNSMAARRLGRRTGLTRGIRR